MHDWETNGSIIIDIKDITKLHVWFSKSYFHLIGITTATLKYEHDIQYVTRVLILLNSEQNSEIRNIGSVAPTPALLDDTLPC